jgi:hypothetical protein
MFGFLNPRPHSLQYRRVYARLCQHQHRHYGIWSLAFHSYEAVFLYQCAADAGAVNLENLPDIRCCRLLTRSLGHDAPDAEIGRFCASVALLLASVKLEDDLRDTHGIPARIARWTLRQRIEQSKSYFGRLDPRFGRNIAALLADHEQLENSKQSISLDRYVEPTSLAFGYVFGLMSRLPEMEQQRTLLVELGHKVGAAIIAFDCAVDWKRDRRRNEFNPLPDEQAVLDSLEQSDQYLSQAAILLRQNFGMRSQAAGTVDAVRQRIQGIRESRNLSCSTPRISPMQILRRTVGHALRTAKYVLIPARMTEETIPSNPNANEPPHGPYVPGQNPQGGLDKDPLPLPPHKSNDCSSGCSSSDASCCASIPDCSGCDGCGDCGGCDCGS